MRSERSNPTIETVVQECLAVRVRRLNRVITGIYDQALRPLGLKVSQMNILVAAAKMHLARPREICRVLQLEASTLSRNIERMRSRGWVEAVPVPDGREQPVRLTASGRQLLQRALPAWGRAQSRAAEVLGEQGVALLKSANLTT